MEDTFAGNAALPSQLGSNRRSVTFNPKTITNLIDPEGLGLSTRDYRLRKQSKNTAAPNTNASSAVTEGELTCPIDS